MTAAASRPMPIPDLAGILKTRPASTPDAIERPARGKATSETNSSGTDEPRKAPTPAATSIAQPASAQKPRRQGRASIDAPPLRRASSPPPTKRTYTRPINIRLPRSVHQTLCTRAAERGMTQVAAILTAVSKTHTELDSQLAKSQPPAAWTGELFDIPQLRAPAEPVVQTSIRVTDAQLEALEALSEHYGVHRSHIITAALELWMNA